MISIVAKEKYTGYEIFPLFLFLLKTMSYISDWNHIQLYETEWSGVIGGPQTPYEEALTRKPRVT